MDEEFQITYVAKPEESVWGIIGRGISQFNKQHAGESNFQRLCFVLQAPDKEFVGGALDTFSFQAPEFYQQHGYQVFGELQNFPSGHQRYFLTKQL